MLKEYTGESLTLYEKGYNWLITEGPLIIIGLLVLCIGLWLISRISRRMHRGMMRQNLDPSLKPFLLSLFIIAMRIVLVLGVLQMIGIQMTIFATLVGALGVAAGLALSGTLQNFASGVLILLLKPFKAGDIIVAQGQEGTVKSIEIFYTVITTFDNRSVIVPNSKLSNEVIINMSQEGTRRLDIQMKFNFGVDVDHVKAIVNKTIDNAKAILKTPARKVGVDKLEADGYTLLINVWLKVQDYEDAKLAFHEKLVEALRESDVGLPGKE
jgi:small conductance mechanosensitive channel